MIDLDPELAAPLPRRGLLRRVLGKTRPGVGRTWVRHAFHPDGEVFSEQHIGRRGQSRLDGPAYREWNAAGRLTLAIWNLEGRPHRPDGPAMIEWQWAYGRKAEEWAFDGKWGRPDGPYRIEMDLRGRIERIEWLFDDRLLDGPAELAEFLASLPAPELRSLFERSRYRPLIEAGANPPAIVAAIAQGVWSVDGVSAVLEGAPAEWVTSFEAGVD